MLIVGVDPVCSYESIYEKLILEDVLKGLLLEPFSTLSMEMFLGHFLGAFSVLPRKAVQNIHLEASFGIFRAVDPNCGNLPPRSVLGASSCLAERKIENRWQIEATLPQAQWFLHAWEMKRLRGISLCPVYAFKIFGVDAGVIVFYCDRLRLGVLRFT